MEHVMICALMPHPPMMIPEIGKDELDKMQDTVVAAKGVANLIKEQNPQTIIIVSPHGPVFEDSASISIHPRIKGNLGKFGAPDIIMGFETDDLLIRYILKQTDRLGINLLALTDDMARDHHLSLELDYGALVPLYYLTKAGFKGQLIHISTGVLSYEEMYTFGKAVQIAIGVSGKKVSVIASGDLSHDAASNGKGSEQGREFDQQVLQAVQELNVKKLLMMDPDLVKITGECGLRSIFFLMGVVSGLDATAELLSYESSFGVGHGVAMIAAKNKSKKTRK